MGAYSNDPLGRVSLVSLNVLFLSLWEWGSNSVIFCYVCSNRFSQVVVIAKTLVIIIKTV